MNRTIPFNRSESAPCQEVRRVTTTAIDRRILAAIQHSLGPESVKVELWDGASTYAGSPEPASVVRIANRLTLLRMLWNPEFWFAEAFARGSLTISGDFMAVLTAAYRHRAPVTRVHDIAQRLGCFVESHSLSRARRSIHQHYDIGNDFYRLWLDKDLVYTCAYFARLGMTLEEAQIEKMEHICRKLQLKTGDRVIEAGCGWGSLALHMAARHSVHVRAFNISHEQITHARQRAAALGLADRVEFVEDDYRNISGRCDVFVSVGMLEHVGLEHYRDLGDVIHRVLTAERGRGLLHFIGRTQPQPLNAWIRRRIFPGAYAPTLGEVTTRLFEPWQFSILDVENLRLHYARTLQQWLVRFDAAADRVQTMFDEEFVRAWRMYLAGSEAAFATGWMQLFQVTFATPQNDQVPWTRAALYRAVAD